MSYHVAGIDLSLTDSGVAVLRGDDLDGRPFVRSIPSSPIRSNTRMVKGKMQPWASLLDRRNRIQAIVARVAEAALAGYDAEVDDAPLFVIEAPLYGSSTGSSQVLERAWLFGLTAHVLFKHGLVIEVENGKHKLYATGSRSTPAGQTSKSATLAAMPRLFPQIVVVNDNVADALALAAMGARALGHPREPSPQRVTPSALNGIDWPSDTARRNPAGIPHERK